MSGSTTARPRQVTRCALPPLVGAWPQSVRACVLADVARSPVASGPAPWQLHYGPECIDLVAPRQNRATVFTDHAERDRILSAGTAAMTLWLTLRAHAARTELTLLPGPTGSPVLARARVTGSLAPRPAEMALYDAVSRRHSCRRAFRAPVPESTRSRLIRLPDLDGFGLPGAALVVIDQTERAAALADLMSYAAAVLRDDYAYQRELAAWTANSVWTPPHAVDPDDTLPWAMIRRSTHLPDVPTLTRRLLGQTTLLVITPDDTRADQIRAGALAQQAWLSAVAAGMAGSMHTQMLRLPEVRAELIERLQLAGYPHLLLRLGVPAPERLGTVGERTHWHGSPNSEGSS